MSDWQNIETSPKDGTQFIVCWHGGDEPPFMRIMSWEGSPTRGGFIDVDGEGGYDAPTLWQPLLDPPEPDS